MKNYVVKAKAVNNQLRGLIKYTTYLIDEKRKSHQQTKITELFNSANKFINYTKSKAEKAEVKNILARKGGKPIVNYARGLTLNFPPSMSPTTEQSKKILSKVLDDIFEFISVPPKPPKKREGQEVEQFEKNVKAYERELKKFNLFSRAEFDESILAVLHDQENAHIHLNLSQYIGEQNMRAYKLKSFVKLVKHSFTLHTDEEMQTNIKDYQIDESQESYDKQEILKKANTDIEIIRRQRLLLSDLRAEHPENEDFYLKIDSDLEKGHTLKAEIKIEKVLKKYHSPSM